MSLLLTLLLHLLQLHLDMVELDIGLPQLRGLCESALFGVPLSVDGRGLQVRGLIGLLLQLVQHALMLDATFELMVEGLLPLHRHFLVTSGTGMVSTLPSNIPIVAPTLLGRLLEACLLCRDVILCTLPDISDSSLQSLYFLSEMRLCGRVRSSHLLLL